MPKKREARPLLVSVPPGALLRGKGAPEKRPTVENEAIADLLN
jgi:hypothetical protein